VNKDEYRRMFEAEDTHWWYQSLHDLVLRVVSEEFRIKGRLDILDAGCGTGRLCQLMAHLGEVYGHDSSAEAIALCQSRGLINLSREDLNTADLGNSRFDVITSIDVLCHSAVKDDSLVMGKFSNALRPGGILVFQSPAYDFLKSRHDIAVHTARRYTTKRVSEMLRAAGFELQMLTYRVTLLFVPIALYRIAFKLLLADNAAYGVMSDVTLPPPALNNLLRRLQGIENRVLPRFPMPFGTSVFAVARKPLI